MIKKIAGTPIDIEKQGRKIDFDWKLYMKNQRRIYYMYKYNIILYAQ